MQLSVGVKLLRGPIVDITFTSEFRVMTGSSRFELNSTSSELGFAGNYRNGQKWNHSGPTLDRSRSFREGMESRISGIGTSRGIGKLSAELPQLSQCLLLEPIVIGDQKYTRAGELRRAMGFSIGSTLENNSFGANHLKPSPALATEDVKHIRSSIVDTCVKARGRARKLDEHIFKLNKYCEALTNKKQQRNEVITTERSGSLNLKMRTQIHQSFPDLVTQKFDDRPKTVLLNKRVRTSVAEAQPECRNNGPLRQPMLLAKDQNLLKEISADSDAVEEKIRRLPAGGEGWDKKMKRKRSVGSVFSKSVDSDGELKRVMNHKPSSEQTLQSCDAHNLRPGANNGTSGVNKFDGTTLPASYSARATPKNEHERATVCRGPIPGLSRELLLTKGSNKNNNGEGDNVIFPSAVTKGKASRTPRAGSIVTTNAGPNIPRIPPTLESWENPPPPVNRIPTTGGTHNRKRAMSSGSSSSPPMAQWVGQRPQKITRTRRSNLVPPVSNSNHDEIQISSEGCSPSDVGATRSTSNASDVTLLSRSTINGSQLFRVKLENVQSPTQLSGSEDSGAGEIKLKEKKLIGSGEANEKVGNAVQNVGPSPNHKKKNKLLVKEEIDDGVRRQGRSGRGSSSSRRVGISSMRGLAANPLRNTGPGSEKSGSKSGLLKKLPNRKGYSQFGHLKTSGSPDITGESDDDREECLAAANFARSASYFACSSSFWKKMEPFFASDKSYLLQQLDQLKLSDGPDDRQPQMFGHGKSVLGDLVHEASRSDTLNYEETNRYQLYHIGNSTSVVKSIDQHSEDDILSGSLNPERRLSNVTPLYQRVLSALISEDEIEESEESNLLSDSCPLVNAGPKRDTIEFECDSVFGVQTESFNFAKRQSNSDSNPSIQNQTYNNELLQGSSGFLRSEVELLTQIGQQNGFDISFDCQYDQICQNDKLLLELQSVGLCPETVPDLVEDREDEVIDQELVRLNQGLHQQIEKKKTCLENIYKAIQGDSEGRNLEQVALDRLVELTYKKLLQGTRGSSKGGAAKIFRQMALGFAIRTLARCQKFEQSGKSCFSEPILHDIIFAAPPRDSNEEALTPVGLAVSNSRNLESHKDQAGPKSSSGSFRNTADLGSSVVFETFSRTSDEAFSKMGPISNRGKKKEVFLDDVVETKGRRSENERDTKDMSTRNGLAKTGRGSQSSLKGERKTKTKPKQKTSQLSTSGNEIDCKFPETTHPVYLSTKLTTAADVPGELSSEGKESMDITNLPLHELDRIERQEDFFDFDDDDSQDDFSGGLGVPMDDLSSVF